MSDRLPGSCWDNPIWHGEWRIFLGEPQYGPQFAYQYIHDGYDGPEDNRAGYAESVEACREEIDEREPSAPDTPTPAGSASMRAAQLIGSGWRPSNPPCQQAQRVSR
jgi:hypothetical protein